MTSCTPVWMTRQDYRRLQKELAALRPRRRPTPRQEHVRELEGERVAEPGMVLTIRYDASGETETFLLGRQGAEDADIKVYSMASPLGRSIAGARPGEQRIYAIPNDAGRLVTLLKAVPYRGHTAPGHGRVRQGKRS
ncbi:GreA/GreB family elongation factor [Mycobacterium sp. 663a-19]|uniref:GreA/GreB family elongation factor n=1 Tax=Mycobacterium sp. 663a-19 TaxID=2986148 RepID=UPI002D1E798C|nr:GreA/GreB family elongation factor [Mycobacterium sp. 663a-19]MEB3979725.1 GreA/GreB family elongation factor [Mycobacterium sp. 663a-19]